MKYYVFKWDLLIIIVLEWTSLQYFHDDQIGIKIIVEQKYMQT